MFVGCILDVYWMFVGFCWILFSLFLIGDLSFTVKKGGFWVKKWGGWYHPFTTTARDFRIVFLLRHVKTIPAGITVINLKF